MHWFPITKVPRSKLLYGFKVGSAFHFCKFINVSAQNSWGISSSVALNQFLDWKKVDKVVLCLHHSLSIIKFFLTLWKVYQFSLKSSHYILSFKELKLLFWIGFHNLRITANYGVLLLRKKSLMFPTIARLSDHSCNYRNFIHSMGKTNTSIPCNNQLIK